MLAGTSGFSSPRTSLLAHLKDAKALRDEIEQLGLFRSCL